MALPMASLITCVLTLGAVAAAHDGHGLRSAGEDELDMRSAAASVAPNTAFDHNPLGQGVARRMDISAMEDLTSPPAYGAPRMLYCHGEGPSCPCCSTNGYCYNYACGDYCSDYSCPTPSPGAGSATV